MTSESACAKDLPAGGRLPCKVSRIPLIPPLQPEAEPRLRRNVLRQCSPVRDLHRNPHFRSHRRVNSNPPLPVPAARRPPPIRTRQPLLLWTLNQPHTITGSVAPG